MGRAELYEGQGLFADPIHEYIAFTVPVFSGEQTEKDLVDSPWMQRLRYIFQLQSSRWVYPSAEHSRFQHSLGAMHLAGRFARHLYPSFKEVVPDCPSPLFVEEVCRLAALMHDIGHGPFGHFFDDNFLADFGLTHEDLGQKIIVEKLGEIIRGVRRSPSGPFENGEEIDPEHLAYLIKKDGQSPTLSPSEKGHGLSGEGYPQWLRLLKPLFNGIYTADNLDYVFRDSYMCGVAIGPVDLERLLYYTFFTKEGLTLHKAGTGALTIFLNARLYLYANVYYHRTTRAIDLHLREIFRPTMAILFPQNPVEDLEAYLHLTDWSLLEEVRRWPKVKEPEKAALGEEWAKVLGRQVKWKMAFGTTIPYFELRKGSVPLTAEEMEKRMRQSLPPELKDLPFKVDMASQDGRPLNPLAMGEMQIYIYDPSTGRVSKEPLSDLLERIPAREVQCRVFALDYRYNAELSSAAEKALAAEAPSTPTSV